VLDTRLGQVEHACQPPEEEPTARFQGHGTQRAARAQRGAPVAGSGADEWSCIDMMDEADPAVLLGVCGLYCGACYHYRASFPEGKHLIEEVRHRGRDVEGFTCGGCRSGMVYVHPGCSQCQIRACAERRRIIHCGECAEFPCDRIAGFQADGRVHHREVLSNLEDLRICGVATWLAAQDQRWRCACGTQFSWYEGSCRRCGASLTSYGRVARSW